MKIRIETPKKLVDKSIGKMWFVGDYDWGYCYHIIKDFNMFSIVSVEMLIHKDTISIEGEDFIQFRYKSIKGVGEIIDKRVKLKDFKNRDKVIKGIIKSIEEFD